MPRFLALLQYTTEGSKVLLKEKVTVRETFARKAIESVGGKVESIYFTASGEYHIAMTAEYPDAATAAEASRAYGSLTPSLRLLRTTVWAFPTISTRWRDTFVYAQAKTELRLAFPIHPYVSLRFIGDAIVRRGLTAIAGL